MLVQYFRPWVLDLPTIYTSYWSICVILGGLDCLLGWRMVYKENAIYEAYIFCIKAS
jgi:hypothetical protein